MTPDPRPPPLPFPVVSPEQPSDASGAETPPEAPPGAATPPDPQSGRVIAALRLAGGNVARAARKLGMSRQQLTAQIAGDEQLQAARDRARTQQQPDIAEALRAAAGDVAVAAMIAGVSERTVWRALSGSLELRLLRATARGHRPALEDALRAIPPGTYELRIEAGEDALEAVRRWAAKFADTLTAMP